MPVIEIQALPQRDGVNISEVICAVSCNAARALGVAPEQVWTNWRFIDPLHYAEGSNPAPAVQPPETHPPIVNIMAYQGRGPDQIARVLKDVAQTLTDELGMGAGNAFVTYTELQSGRVYTGGQVR